MEWMRWECRTIDIRTAYLQGDQMKRRVWVRPPKEARIGGSWELQKTVYGLKDSARMWYEKVVKIIRDLRGERSKLEPAMFYWSEKGKLIGIMCIHVDDFCFGETEKFLKEVIGRLKEKLRMGEEELSKFRYIGVNVQRDEGVWMKQDRYIDIISAPIEEDFNDDRELNGDEL